MNEDERKRVAYHEAGHAVAGWFLENSDPLLKVTIIPRSKGALGFAQYLPNELSLHTKEQLLDMIKTALGGRIAEELFYDSVTTGASDDIKKVTQIANGLVQTYGMTKNIGLVGYGSMGGEDTMHKPYSDETNWKIDEAVRDVVKDQYERTKQLLIEHKAEVDAAHGPHRTTALHIAAAAKEDRSACVRFLLAAKAGQNSHAPRNSVRLTYPLCSPPRLQWIR